MDQNLSETVNSYLNALSDDELRSIINDSNQETRLEELSQKCSILTKLKQEKEVLIGKNKSLADHNYGREPTYNNLRKVLEEAHKESVELKQRLLEKQQKLNKLKPKMTPDTLRGLLQVAAQESEEQSEEIAKQFLSGEKTYEEFIKEFIKIRTEYHKRRIKQEKLIDSIQNPSRSTNFTNNMPSSSSLHSNLPQSSNFNQINSNNLSSLPNSIVSSNLNPLPYPTNLPSSNAPFAYQPFNQVPIRSAPLPPHMSMPPMELPPYAATPFNQPTAYPHSTSNLPSYPFHNPNYR